MEEVWRDIPGFNGKYKASDKGRIMAIRFRNSNNDSILKQSTSNGYLVLNLFNGKSKLWRVHRLIALTFISNPENKKAINHKNGNKKDNRVENLEWVTKSENELHKHRVLGQPGTMKGRIGILNSKSMPISQYTLSGEFIKTWACGNDVQREIGFDNRNIYACCRGFRKSAYGFIWKLSNRIQ